MTGNEIIWNTLKFIELNTIEAQFVNVFKTRWKDYDLDTKLKFRNIMRQFGLIRLAESHSEFQLTDKGYDAKERDFKKGGIYYTPELDSQVQIQIDLEKKFLEFLNERETALSTEIDIKEFMVDNFSKPDPKSANTTNENDLGVNFLKNLKEKKLIEYDDIALSHVNSWCVDAEGKIKRWFDTLHEPLYVNLTSPTRDDTLFDINPIATNKSHLKKRDHTSSFLKILNESGLNNKINVTSILDEYFPSEEYENDDLINQEAAIVYFLDGLKNEKLIKYHLALGNESGSQFVRAYYASITKAGIEFYVFCLEKRSDQSQQPMQTTNYHFQGINTPIIGNNNHQSFKTRDIINTNNSNNDAPAMGQTMKWILATISTIVAGLIVWWLTK
ncbi:MAG: hypothetical protein JO080_01780 [Mucilaginibacter sp.]|nr:hypothetical protein [Mucilaginibacter sp.]